MRQAFRRPRPRTRTAPTRASQEKRLAGKARAARIKARRRRVDDAES
jgi:hypothetical protein